MLKKLLPLVLVTCPLCFAGCSDSSGAPAADAGHGGSADQSSTDGAGGTKAPGASGAKAGAAAVHAGASASGTGGDGGGASAPSNLIGSDPIEQFLSELITEMDGSTSRVVKGAAGSSATAVFDLLGNDTSTTTQADLVSSCTAQTKPSTTCLGDLPSHTTFIVPGINECFQSSCDGSGKGFIDIFITKGTMKDPAQRVAISYSSSAPYPSATIDYAQNPLTHWVIDTTDPDSAKATANVDGSISVKLDSDGSTIDLSYSGTISGQNAKGKVSYKIALTFPDVMSGGPVTVELDSDDGTKTGQISMASKTLATVQNDPLIVWQ
jgi:hypothetical protein